MALVNRMEKISRTGSVHNEVEATYNVIYKNGVKYLQINTYGSRERKVKGSVSQSMQFSEEAINQLKGILQTNF